MAARTFNPSRVIIMAILLWQCDCFSLSSLLWYNSNNNYRDRLQLSTRLLDGITSEDCATRTTMIGNSTFRIPTLQQIETISTHQVHHTLTPKQTFCISQKLCTHCHPQSFGFHPTAGTKLSSGLFRLSCPLLVEAIDEWEASGGVREMSDWLMQNDTRTSDDCDDDMNWKQIGYQDANEMQKRIRQSLVSSNDRKLLADKLGEYNANRFMESGIAGIPSDQTFSVKCIHAHVADHLCRVSSSKKESTLDTILYGDGNIIGKKALQLLHKKGVNILGNDVCWQQCNGSEGWRYIARKNRRGLKSTRLRRKQIKHADCQE